ncbi:hypothetical protein CKM354_001258800 [Cercospora kikuchii]|uniref:RING-type domain-containing protein n=1 Tax=Cercospora kikuchii TaxID=84275 RepID=A0A9P3L216_9PEZI|nr:uncharacterized protein CKM354_001258800 [Cercospora kikuchii]GIZ49558.1 hypothetical protein CKM354_001258800 [Cercospora kikuchii]
MATEHPELESSQAGDLLLIISTRPSNNASSSPFPPGLAAPTVRLLLIDSGRYIGSIDRSTTYVRSADLSPQDWISYQRNPPTFWLETRRDTTSMPLDDILSDTDRVILRPSFDTLLGYFFNGNCPFESCQDGLVVIDETTREVLSDFAEPATRSPESESRRRAISQRPRTIARTLCPFCMGATMYRDQEVAVARAANWRGEDYEAIVMRNEEHLERINARRRQLGYRALADDANLAYLRDQEQRNETALAVVVREAGDGAQAGAGAELTRQETLLLLPWYAVLDGSAERSEVVRSLSGGVVIVAIDASAGVQIQVRAGPSNSGTPAAALPAPSQTPVSSPLQTPGPAVPRLRTRDWYAKAARRVLVEACQICLEKFKPGEIVVDLPCWHFFHEECWMNVESGRCPFRCNEGVVMTEQSDENEEETDEDEEEQMEVEEIT